MNDHYLLHKILGNLRNIIGIAKFDDTKILIDTCDELLNDIALQIDVILITCVIRDGGKFYTQIILEEALYD